MKIPMAVSSSWAVVLAQQSVGPLLRSRGFIPLSLIRQETGIVEFWAAAKTKFK